MIFLNIIILFIYIFLWSLSKNYEKNFVDKLDEKQHRLKVFYSMGLYLIDKVSDISFFDRSNTQFTKLDDPLKALYVGEQLDVVKRLYLCNKLVMVLMIVFISNLLSFTSNIMANDNNQLQDGKFIRRPGYNQGAKEVELKVQVSEDESTILEEDIQFEVEEKRYGSTELDNIFTYAKEYIDSKILYNNESAEIIRSDLMFVSQIPETGLTVKWITGDHELVDEEGRIHNEEITENVLVWVTAVITYHDREEEYTRYFNLLPKEYSVEENARKDLLKALSNAADKSQKEEMLTLPDTIEQQRIAWAEKKDNTGLVFLVLGSLTAILLYVMMDRDLTGKVEKRNREMLLDYPEIVNKFTLLVGAGMSLSNTWCKICQDYKESGLGKRYAYEEMMITYGELMIGTSETIAYERFGRRVKLIPYLRFSSLIAQSVKKGSSGLLDQLDLEVVEAFEERKELAKRMGEEAGTKLLVPMLLMLLIVLAIIIVPAFLSFGI